MALLKGKINEIPKDAIILSENDAAAHQARFLKKWKTKSDVWAFNHGGTILAALSAMSGIYFNNHYRTKVKLLRFGHMASYLPICVLPAVLSYGTHCEMVLRDVVLQKSCAVCTELRASALQAGFGCAFPAILAPLASYALATRYSTYNMPYLTEVSKSFQIWRNHTKPIGNVIFGIFVAQALAGSIITYCEAKNIERVNEKLTLLGYDLEN